MGWRDFLHRAEDTEGDLVASSKKSKLFLVDFGRKKLEQFIVPSCEMCRTHWSDASEKAV